MTNPNWGLLQGNNALGMFQQGAQMGQAIVARREERENRNALLDMRQQELAMRQRESEARAGEAASKRQGEQLVMGGRLARAVRAGELDYATALQIGQRQGLDVSKAPQAADPKWLNEQIAIGSLYEKDGGQTLSVIARELQDAGYKLDSPEGQAALRSVIQNKYAAEYVDEAGNTRRRSALNLQPSQGGPQPGAVEDGYRFKGGNPADPNAWEQVGGPTPPASGGFRP